MTLSATVPVCPFGPTTTRSARSQGSFSQRLSAALPLGRRHRRVLVLDDGEPHGTPVRGVHALAGRDKEEAARSRDGRPACGTAGFRSGRVTCARRAGRGLTVGDAAVAGRRDPASRGLTSGTTAAADCCNAKAAMPHARDARWQGATQTVG